MKVQGIRPPDERYKKMAAAWMACTAAGVTVPDEVEEYMDGLPPTKDGVIIDIGWCVKETKGGVEIDTSLLPPGVTVIRVST